MLHSQSHNGISFVSWISHFSLEIRLEKLPKNYFTAINSIDKGGKLFAPRKRSDGVCEFKRQHPKVSTTKADLKSISRKIFSVPPCLNSLADFFFAQELHRFSISGLAKGKVNSISFRYSSFFCFAQYS